MRQNRHNRKKFFGIGSFNPVGTGICANLPSYCIKNYGKAGFLSNVTTSQTVGIASGIGLYITGLRYFNKRFIEYRKAKIKKDTQKMNIQIDFIVKELISKNPNISYSKAKELSKKELEKRIFEEQDKEKHDKTIKEALKSGMIRKEDIPDIEKLEQEGINIIIKKEKITSKYQLKNVLKNKYPDMSNKKINESVDKYYNV